MRYGEHHIFEELSDGKIVWHGSVSDVQTALLRMLDLKIRTPNHNFFVEFFPGNSAEMAFATEALPSDRRAVWH